MIRRVAAVKRIPDDPRINHLKMRGHENPVHPGMLRYPVEPVMGVAAGILPTFKHRPGVPQMNRGFG